LEEALAFARRASRSRSKWLVLAVLMLVGLTNYADRLSISILQVPIRAELQLSDAQLGAITGLSFSLVYTFAALPMARLADRFSPKRVIVASLVVWNVMTMLCGLATGFLGLAALRMGVAIGEAGSGPATQALIARAFPADQRGRAIAVWQMVFPLGSLGGIAAGGLLSEAMGWRHAFVVLGAAGLAVAPLVIWLVSDRAELQPAESQRLNPRFAPALKELLASRSFALLLAGGFVAAMPLNAALNWNALFYGRVFHLPMGELTLYLALIAGLGGALGMFGGGFVSDWLGRRDARWYCWLPSLALLIALPLMVGQYVLATTPSGSLLLGVLVYVLLNCWMPPQAAIAQSLVQPDSRALAAACILVTAGVGAALGPFVTGVISDGLATRLGSDVDALRYALAIVAGSALLASAFFFAAARDLEADLSRPSQRLCWEVDISCGPKANVPNDP
jgi:predicted MFS family arabinose efflux permease